MLKIRIIIWLQVVLSHKAQETLLLGWRSQRQEVLRKLEEAIKSLEHQDLRLLCQRDHHKEVDLITKAKEWLQQRLLDLD